MSAPLPLFRRISAVAAATSTSAGTGRGDAVSAGHRPSVSAPRRATARPLTGLAAMVLAALVGASGPAGAGPAKVAVLPFELGDPGAAQDATGDPAAAAMALMNGGASTEDKRRLTLVSDEMRKLLAAASYAIVDLGPQAKEIDDKSPLNRCNGCEADIAKAAGAELSVLGRVQKLTPVLIHFDIAVRDTTSGDLVRSVSVDVNGDTDEMWLRGVRWLFKNRLSEPPLK